MTLDTVFQWREDKRSFIGRLEQSDSLSDSFRALNLLLCSSDHADERLKARLEANRGADVNAAYGFFLTSILPLLERPLPEWDVYVKIVLPSRSGYVVRADLLSHRMHGCQLVRHVQDLAKPGQYFNMDNGGHECHPNVADFLPNALGLILVRKPADLDYVSSMRLLDAELEIRLALPWILPNPITERPLAIVGHRHPTVTKGYLSSATAFGMRLIIIDDEDSIHIMESTASCTARYIPINMMVDDGLSARIIEAVSSDGNGCAGIVTFTDTLRVAVSEAATALGLPSLPTETVKTCLDKYATRSLVHDKQTSLKVKDQEDLADYLRYNTLSLEYPLIAKPCTSWGSQGVFKAETLDQLFEAVTKAKATNKLHDVIIDSYVDGPEVDANFVLQDGEVLFFEIVDGFPCTAEIKNKEADSGDFLETDEVWPSAHPLAEKEAVRSVLLAVLRKLDVRDGIFHMECRIKNSAMEYRVENDHLDLRPKRNCPSGNPSPFLLEINARPPGHGGSWGASLAYGIDYFALHMLSAMGDKDRFLALAQPFRNGACQWVDSVFINVRAAGIYAGGDLCQELRDKRPDLMAHVHYCTTYYKRGEAVQVSPARVALFMVVSSEGREALLRVATQIRNVLKPEMIYQ
ncbi:hypothetical protein GGS24DRAFT_467228 [Hypoxylon argillaceum]|nr:hypothetical protein GGS24DRAFT_467228 [Hypoxylon argillaceum]